MANGTTSAVKSSIGWLYAAALAVSEPTDCSTALPSTFYSLGYTDGGIEIAETITIEPIEVDQEGQPIDYKTTKLETKVTANLAEPTRRNLSVVWGLGSGAANSSSVLTRGTYGSELGVFLVHDTLETPDATNVRTIIRKAMPSGTVSLKHAKAPEKVVLPVEFLCVKTAAGNALSIFPNASGHVA